MAVLDILLTLPLAIGLLCVGFAVRDAAPPRPMYRDVDVGRRIWGEARQVPVGLEGEAMRSCRQRGAAVKHRRRILRQAVEPQRLVLDLPVKAGDADLRERHALPAIGGRAASSLDLTAVLPALVFTMLTGMLAQGDQQDDAMRPATEADEPKRVPGRKRGPAQREELLRIWNAVDDDGRKMLLFVSRTIAVKQGLAADGVSLLGTEPVW